MQRFRPSVFLQTFLIPITLLFFIPIVNASVVFTDGDFSSGWNDITNFVWDDPRVSDPAPLLSTSSVGNESNGGNPGAFRMTTINWYFGDAIIGGGINQNAFFDPSNLAISYIDMSLDVFPNIVDTVDTNGNPIQGIATVGFGAVIQQGGVPYFSGFLGSSSQGWTSLSLNNLTANDFSSYGANPDFSINGEPIYLGFAMGHGSLPENEGLPPLILVHGADNWSATLNTIPIPGAAWLLGSGLVGLVAVTRRNKS